MSGETLTLTCLLLFHLVTHAHTAMTKVCPPLHERRPHRYGICGENIPNALAQICPGMPSNDKIKRDSQVALRDIGLEKKSALSYLTKRAIHTITCECCFNMCSLPELYYHCP